MNGCVCVCVCVCVGGFVDRSMVFVCEGEREREREREILKCRALKIQPIIFEDFEFSTIIIALGIGVNEVLLLRILFCKNTFDSCQIPPSLSLFVSSFESYEK